ncbi:MAG: aldehyde dehydrogenase [Sphingomonas fennica]
MAEHLLPDGVSIAHPTSLYIDGRWVAPAGGGTIEVVSPNSEQVVAIVAEGGEADMDAAVDAAARAFAGPWSRTRPEERIRLIRALGAALAERQSELAAAWTAQVGGLASFAPMMVGGGTATFTNVANVAEKFQFEKPVASMMAAAGVIAYEPVGVVAAIAPWNAPYAIMAGKVAPALAAGCTVVMKPSPETPLEAYIIAEAAEAVGIPAGVVNLVPSHREAADYLVRNPRVDKVSFTGSTVAGRRIASVCGERIARCSLELGGKSAAIVRDDFATEQAAKLLANTISIMSGQVCAMLSRVIVPRTRHDELADAIAGEMKQIRLGHSDDPETRMGPLAMQRQLERVEDYIAKGKAEGADMLTGGARATQFNRGYFLEPTLFANVSNDQTIAQEEIFGPVLSLIPCEDEEDAIRIANDSIYGLSGSVLTNDADAAYRIARRVRTGTIAQNGLKGDFTLPFGGFKQSGLGREGGEEGLMEYLESKTILLDAAPATLAV